MIASIKSQKDRVQRASGWPEKRHKLGEPKTPAWRAAPAAGPALGNSVRRSAVCVSSAPIPSHLNEGFGRAERAFELLLHHDQDALGHLVHVCVHQSCSESPQGLFHDAHPGVTLTLGQEEKACPEDSASSSSSLPAPSVLGAHIPRDLESTALGLCTLRVRWCFQRRVDDFPACFPLYTVEEQRRSPLANGHSASEANYCYIH
eukprot:XP_024305164.1 uncharacterized protein LOC643365 isoform X1 [Homo sapiens]